jgi:hypothetical protein
MAEALTHFVVTMPDPVRWGLLGGTFALGVRGGAWLCDALWPPKPEPPSPPMRDVTPRE